MATPAGALICEFFFELIRLLISVIVFGALVVN